MLAYRQQLIAVPFQNLLHTEAPRPKGCSSFESRARRTFPSRCIWMAQIKPKSNNTRTTKQQPCIRPATTHNCSSGSRFHQCCFQSGFYLIFSGYHFGFSTFTFAAPPSRRQRHVGPTTTTTTTKIKTDTCCGPWQRSLEVWVTPAHFKTNKRTVQTRLWQLLLPQIHKKGGI